MKKIQQALCALVACAVLVGVAACVQNSETGGTAANANANAGGANANTGATAAASPQSAGGVGAGAAASAGNLPVTLPVLDALFAEASFAGELKSRLGLSDEQVERLKQAAREEREGLAEGEGDAHAGTTSEATARAAEKIRAAVGAEKSEQVLAFVRERWSTGGEGAAAGVEVVAAAKPNAVPADTRVVVNIPAYRMDAFEGGRLVKTYKVGIGYPEFPLPTGLRKASQIIFNPEWTPPDEPWVKGKFKPGEKVDAGSKDNPLGLIKIPIGSPSLIHGGKSPARLGTFASHGCVGLTNAQVQDFATILARLGGAQLTREQVLANAKVREETKNVKLASAVPVELRYETIVVEDGKLHIYRDVYGHGTNTEENLRKTLEAYGVRLEDLSEPERAQVTQALNEMARDALGKPATEAQPTPTPAPRKGGAASARETKTMKGKKEIVVEIAALRGKGYPAPANFDAGTGAPPKPAPQKAAQASAKPRA